MMLPPKTITGTRSHHALYTRHGGVLQADDAVTRHRNRPAGYFGVALRQVDRDILVDAGNDLRLIVGVIDGSFVQAAVARRAIDRQIFDPERVEHIDHKIAAARGLIYRIGCRRHGLGGDLPGTRNGSLARLRGGRDSIGGSRRNYRGSRAGEARAFEEIAAAGIGGTAALRHESSLEGQCRREKNRRVCRLIKLSPRR